MQTFTGFSELDKIWKKQWPVWDDEVWSMQHQVHMQNCTENAEISVAQC